MNDISPNPKCSVCRCYFIPNLKSSGLPYKCCHKCRERTNMRCEHNKEKSKCNVFIIEGEPDAKNVAEDLFVFKIEEEVHVMNVNHIEICTKQKLIESNVYRCISHIYNWMFDMIFNIVFNSIISI